MASVWSRSAMIISFGESGFSVFHAGHWSWQRPHSVQVVMSRTPFQVKSSAAPTPSLASSSRSSRSSRVSALPPLVIGFAAPRATGARPNITFSGATKMCRCLELSTKIRKASITPMCRSRPMPISAVLSGRTLPSP